ncbi:MAG: radical SAM protein [Anaerolineae bacterium]|nr:radical SAM protein [Anaerolineae bacterium]
MPLATCNYWLNLFKLLRRDDLLLPLAAAYYPTMRCNLNCAYCEDFGAQRNDQAGPDVSFDEALRVLGAIRVVADSLILTGGEPLLYPHIDELIARARRDLRFRQITVLSNGLLLSQHEDILPLIDRLVISLDDVEPARWHSLIGVAEQTARQIVAHVAAYAARQREFGYRLVANCVLAPQTLPHARAVLDFCVERGLWVSFSPQSVHGWPHYDLLVSTAYRAFVRELIALKKRGAPVVGSLAYLRASIDWTPYGCFPTLVPRVLANGDLIYPCRAIEKEGSVHGGRVNLLQVGSWREAMAAAVRTYGNPPRFCASCFQQCYAEPSLMQFQPLSFLYEWLHFPVSRQAGLATFAPG